MRRIWGEYRIAYLWRVITSYNVSFEEYWKNAWGECEAKNNQGIQTDLSQNSDKSSEQVEAKKEVVYGAYYARNLSILSQYSERAFSRLSHAEGAVNTWLSIGGIQLHSVCTGVAPNSLLTPIILWERRGIYLRWVCVENWQAWYQEVVNMKAGFNYTQLILGWYPKRQWNG